MVRRKRLAFLASAFVFALAFSTDALASKQAISTVNDYMYSVRADITAPNSQIYPPNYTTAKCAIWLEGDGIPGLSNVGWMVQPPAYPHPRSYNIWLTEDGNQEYISIWSVLSYGVSRPVEIYWFQSNTFVQKISGDTKGYTYEPYAYPNGVQVWAGGRTSADNADLYGRVFNFQASTSAYGLNYLSVAPANMDCMNVNGAPLVNCYAHQYYDFLTYNDNYH